MVQICGWGRGGRRSWADQDEGKAHLPLAGPEIGAERISPQGTTGKVYTEDSVKRNSREGVIKSGSQDQDWRPGLSRQGERPQRYEFLSLPSSLASGSHAANSLGLLWTWRPKTT